MDPLKPTSDPVIFSNGNIAGVQNGPGKATTFTIDAAHRVTFIYTYHYFNGGKKAGTIGLKHSDGTMYGPWQAKGSVGQGGVPHAYWSVYPNVEIKPGIYTVIDSDNPTWSHNSGSNGTGFAEVRGVKTGTAQPPQAHSGELLKNGDFSQELSGWTMENNFMPSSGGGEVAWKDGGVTFSSAKGNTRYGVMQPIGKDVSGCSHLMLKAVVKADLQTLDGTGWQGREAPVGVYAAYIDTTGVDRSGLPSLALPAEPQGSRMFWNGFYFKDPTGNSRSVYGTKVQSGQWYSFVVDLMSLDPRPKTLKFVGAQGSGWSPRTGAVTAMSLVCNGDATPLPIPAQQVKPPASTDGMDPLKPTSDPIIFSNGNIAGVQNGPGKATTFTIDAAHRVTFIYTYHYFNGGKKAGTIGLKHSDGTMYGPWQAKGSVGQGGVPHAYWSVYPNVEIKPGTYTVIDSDNPTWSHNSGSQGAGFAEVRGVKTGTAATSAQPATHGINGLWNTSEGAMTFTHNGTSVTALYSQDNGHITATLAGNTLEGIWMENGSNQRCSTPRTNKDGQTTYHWGGIRLTFSGDTFSGSWGYCEQSTGHPWTGSRSKAAPQTAASVLQQPAQSITIAGNWSAVINMTSFLKENHWLNFKQNGSAVHGSYSSGNGRITATLTGNVLEGVWMQDSSMVRCTAPRTNNDGVSTHYWGGIKLTFSGDGYSGAWGYCEESPGYAWTGIRVK